MIKGMYVEEMEYIEDGLILMVSTLDPNDDSVDLVVMKADSYFDKDMDDTCQTFEIYQLGKATGTEISALEKMLEKRKDHTSAVKRIATSLAIAPALVKAWERIEELEEEIKKLKGAK